MVEYYFDDAVDSIAEQLGSVEVRATPLTAAVDPLFLQSWAFAEEAALGTWPVPEASVLAAVDERGVPVRGMNVQFVVESNRANDLVVTEMRARVLRATPPLSGTLLLPRLGGGPELEPVVKARFHVGGADPRAFNGRERTEEPLFGDSKLRLAHGDSMILDVTGIAANDCYCEWVVDIDLAIGGEIRTVTVPDIDNPLQLTAPVQRYDSVYVSQEPSTDVTAVDPADACDGDCVANPPSWLEG